MTSTLAALVLLTTLPSTDPFRHMTYSWEDAQGQVLYYYKSYNPQGQDLTPGVFTTPMTSEAQQAGCSCPMAANTYHETPPQDLDWTKTYPVYIDLQVEGMKDVSWPSEDKELAALNHLHRTFQQISDTLLNNVGLRLQIVHIHFMDSTVSNSNATYKARTRWPSIYSTKYVFRIGHKMGSNVSPVNSICDYSLLQTGRAIYDWSLTPEDQTAWNWRLHSLTHELTHGLLGLQHSQCYRHDDGTPYEYCWDNACWTGETLCPSQDSISYMGNCSGCYWPMPLQLDSFQGPLAAIARQHLVSAPCLKPDPGCQIGPTNYQSLYLLALIPLLWRKDAKPVN